MQSSFPSLRVLLLSNNTKLSGQLPSQMSGPANLTTLDLSNCSLRGHLPCALPQQLTNLSLSHNALSGDPEPSLVKDLEGRAKCMLYHASCAMSD